MSYFTIPKPLGLIIGVYLLQKFMNHIPHFSFATGYTTSNYGLKT